MSGVLIDVADYLDEHSEDLSLEPREIVRENPDMAPPTSIHRDKRFHKNTVLGLADYLAGNLEGDEPELEGSEPLMEGEQLEVYRDKGSYVFYDGSEEVLDHGSKLEGSKKVRLLEELLEGRKYEEAHDEIYEDATKQAHTNMGMQKVMDDEGYLKDEYVDDIEMFLDDHFRSNPVGK